MKLLYIILLMFIAGCDHTPTKEYIEVPVLVPVECEDFGRIESVEALPVKFVQAVDKDGNQVLGLRGAPYSNLSIIIRGALTHIKEQTKAIDYYKQCIADHNAITLTEEGVPE
jgi:hypothetical protein